MKMPYWIDLAIKFDYRYTLNKDTGCLEWTGSRNNDGYGHLKCNGYMFQAHRVAYFLHYKFIDDRKVLHTCDNPPCVNWEHLYLGTNKENYDDMHKRNRVASLKGTNNPRAKLNDKLIIEIINKFKPGMRYQELADEYQVTAALIGQIIRGDIWKHIKRPIYSNFSNHMCKLQPNDIPEIIERFNNGERQCDLAKEFNVADATIHRLLNGITWKDIII
jgi:Mor family transcriptional regulator